MQHQNLVAMFEASAKAHNTKPCFRYVESGVWQTLTWNEVRDRVIRMAGGLRRLGVKAGDRVCIISKTRYEWTLADLAILAAGGVAVPIYESNIQDQVAYIIENSDAVLIFIENDHQRKKVKAVQKDLPKLKNIVSFEPLKNKAEGEYELDELMLLSGNDAEHLYLNIAKTLTPGTDASFVYTSGTTGNPKGAILTHENFLSELASGHDAFKFKPHYESLIFLPLAHILARVVQFFQLYAGFVQCYAESIEKLLDNITEVKPHFMASVPRIFEKIYTRTLQSVESSSNGKKKIFEWALDVGKTRSRAVLNRQAVPLATQVQYAIANQLVFSKLHQKLGGRMEFFISGGAPLSVDVATFFHAFGFEILEGYGLTETSAAITINRMGDVKIGTVGKPIKDCEVKIAADGEILVRGKMVFRGYYKNPEATAEAIDSEGWFRTGDVGEFDQEGFLRITDRKKDIIVTAAGKNIAPQNIENFMKNDPYISQFVVHGDRRKFLSALVTLDRPQIEKYAQDNKINFGAFEELISHQKVYDFIRTRIEEKNQKLAKYETIKRFAILPTDFTIESGELTPSLKIKRKVITKKYQTILDGFYSE